MFSCCSRPEIISDDLVEKEEKSPVVVAHVTPPECKPHEDLLNSLLKEKPYLAKEEHSLRYYVDLCRDAINAGKPDAAQNALDNLTMELDGEEKMIAAAFVKFDTDRSGVLHGEEIRFMLDYLGFPDSTEDVRRLLEVVDTDGDASVSFDEFLGYVGQIGGTSKLFEVRRQQIQDRGEFKASSLDKDTLRFLLQEAGIHPEAQASWRLVASESELDSAALMQPCQQEAVRHIRALAQENHQRALPGLQARFAKLGKTDSDLWMCLSWIRELAPILVHVNLDKIGEFLKKDTHYRNQFETNTSGGLLKTSARIKWERGLFGTAYDGAKHFDRPKYGVQNIWNDPKGVQGCKQYGDSYLILKDVRLRCTLSPEDSANLPARRLSVLDFYGHVLMEYSDKELLETVMVAERGAEKVGDSAAVIEKWGKYKEAQIHGEVSFDKHVERLVAHERHRKDGEKIPAIAEAHGWKFSWMDDFASHLEGKKGGRELDEKAWKEKLAKLGRVGTAKLDSVAEGMCSIGCGRPCAPGKSFCCRGCQRGFGGHDSTCVLSAAKIADGTCKMGCGKACAPGKDFCCPRCAKGTGLHDRTCGMSEKALAAVAEGFCKRNCGRKVAPGLTKGGRPFDTCCRNCAIGKGHSPKCIA